MRRFARGLLLMGAAFAAGCGEPVVTTNPLLVCDSAAAAVTTGTIQTAIVDVHCVECHKTGGLAADYGLWTTAALTQAAVVGVDSIYEGSGGTLKIVEANKPANSTFMLKLLGGSPKVKGPKGENISVQMPQGKAALSDAEKTQVRDWICSGAQM